MYCDFSGVLFKRLGDLHFEIVKLLTKIQRKILDFKLFEPLKIQELIISRSQIEIKNIISYV